MAVDAQAEQEQMAQRRKLNAITKNAVMLYELAQEAANPRTETRAFHARAKALVAKIDREASE